MKHKWTVLCLILMVLVATVFLGAYLLTRKREEKLPPPPEEKDTAPPTIHNIEYKQQIFKEEPQLIRVNASDNKAMDKVLIEVITPGNMAKNFSTELINELYVLNFTDTSPLGVYEIRAFAFDKAGNFETKAEYFTVNLPPPPYIKNLI